jgi:hypothetical protein
MFRNSVLGRQGCAGMAAGGKWAFLSFTVTSTLAKLNNRTPPHGTTSQLQNLDILICNLAHPALPKLVSA